MARKEYHCSNPTCTLGRLGQLGRFTGGMTAEAAHLVSGEPVDVLQKGVDYGDGICPNCGEPGALYDAEKERD